MVSMIFAALLLALSQEVLGSCKSQYYAYDTTAKCAVNIKISIPFSIKETKPSPTGCDTAKTICSDVTSATAVVVFRGTIPTATTSITIGDGTKNAIVPVIHRVANQEVADPLVGIFPTGGIILAADNLVFTVTISSPSITAGGDLEAGTAGTNCNPNKLCFAIAADKVRVWGTRGTFDKITVSNSGGATVIIPLRTEAADEVLPSPLALVLPVGSAIADTMDISVGIGAHTVTPNGGDLVDKVECGTNEGCYEIKANSDVTLAGVMPSDMLKIEYTGHNAGEYASYTFKGAARLLTAGLLPVLLAFLTSM